MSMEPYADIRQCLDDYKALKKALYVGIHSETLIKEGYEKLHELAAMCNDRKILLKGFLLVLRIDSNPDANELFQSIVEAL